MATDGSDHKASKHQKAAKAKKAKQRARHGRGLAVRVAASACAAERKASGVEAFRAKYGTPHAFRKCVKAGVPAAREKVKAARTACKAERDADKAAFKAKYGNKRGKHAFRRCVRSKLKPAAPTTA